MQWIIVIIILIAFFCESLFGFGGGLISIPLVSTTLPVKVAVNVILIFQLLMGVLLVRTWKYIDWKTLRFMALGLLIGGVLGALSLKVFSDVLLRKFLAVSIVLFLVKMILFPKVVVDGKNRIIAFVSGLVGAYFQGIIGIGGPVLTMYLLTAVPEKRSFRATLIFIFFVTSVLRFGVALQSGLLTPAVWSYAIPGILPFLLVIFVGQRIHTKIPDTYYRYAVYLILLGSSLSLFLKR